MKKLNDILVELLKKDERYFTTEGELLKNAVYEDAGKMDPSLIKLLLSDDTCKSRFFTEVDGVLVFDKVGFGWVINNREFLPDSYTRYKRTIGLIDSKEAFLSSSNDVVLAFPYKDCVLEFDSTDEDEKRTEVFYNETLCHDDIDQLFYRKVFANAKKYTVSGVEDVTSYDGENLIIKGNNLLALHSLRNRFSGQVKLMYWDILYNTDSDQVPYNDSFKHSSWLTMMKNRIEIAYELIKNEGAMCLHCDITEMPYLKVLCDEIFKRENCVSVITCKVKAPSGVASGAQAVFDCSEYILVYAKNKPALSYNHVIEDAEIVNETSKTSDFYKYMLHNIDYSKKEFVKEIDGEKIYRIAPEYFDISVMESQSSLDYYNSYTKIFRTAALSGGKEKKVKAWLDTVDNALDYLYVYEHIPTKGKKAGVLCQDLIYKKGGVLMLSDFVRVDHKKKQVIKTQHITSIFANDWWQGIASEGNATLKNGKKPEILIKTLLDMFTERNDIVLDAYLGSGTTTAVAHKMGRRYIGIEQLDNHYKKSMARMKNVIEGEQTGVSKVANWEGGGSFVCCELAQLNQKYVDSIEKANTAEALVTILSEMLQSGFISSNVNPKDIDSDAEDFKALSLDDKKRLLMALLDKNMLYVNYCDMNDETFAVSEADKAFTNSFYKEA